LENKIVQLKTTVNTLEETFTTWESKEKEVKPSEITEHQHDK
jgi:hypothetical protein